MRASTAASWVSANLPERSRSPGSQIGADRPMSNSSAPAPDPRRSVRVVPPAAGGPAIHVAAARCAARAASVREAREAASGWVAHAASKACDSVCATGEAEGSDGIALG